MGDAEQLLEGLDPEQQAVARALIGPVCVLAGAGTGKTRAITHRIGYGVATGTYAPGEVLAVTFTTRAAGELRSRLRLLGAGGVQARTFHSAALRQARYFWPAVFGGQLPELVASKIPLLAEATRRCRVESSSALLRDVAAEVEWAKVTNVRPDDYERVAGASGREAAGLEAATLARVFAAYEEVKRDRQRIDMEDVLLCAAAVLEQDERVVAQVRRQYRWFVVDEFQDVSPIQWALLELWLGGRDGVCVVGDPMQTIYSFAGASSTYLTGFPARYPHAERLSLVRNYRSTPQVIEVANGVAHAVGLQRRADGGAVGAQPVVLRSQSPAGPPVEFTGHANEVDEAEWVAGRIARLRDAGTPLREIAVLFRINAQSETVEEALAGRSIPYVMRGVERFFERAEVKQAVLLLRGAARAGAEGSGDLVNDTRSVLSGMGWSDQAPTGTGVQRDRWESLYALTTVAAEVAAGDPASGLSQLVAELDRRAEVQHLPVAEGVTLATLHSAKGLEWDAVFLTGMHEGTMPIVYATTDAAVQEERRLFYVGITRARSALSVSWASARLPGGRSNRAPSRFLDGIRPVEAAAGTGSMRARRAERSGRAVRRCRGCDRPLGSAAERKIGRCSACPATYDEQLFERLRAWRSGQAQEQQLPAYCVFTDATLVAIAELRPTDDRGLVSIPGIGQTKLDRYGEQVLALCAQDDSTVSA